MAVEQSCFQTEQDVRAFIEQSYGFVPERVEKLTVGSANCFQIWARDERFFLKEFQEKFDRSALEHEIRVCTLVSSQVPTSRFVKNLEGNMICEAYGRVFHLQHFLTGATYSRNQFGRNLLRQEAVTLGKIHRCLEGKITLPDGFPEPWFDGWDKTRAIAKYERILTEKQEIQKEQSQKLAAACRTKLALLRDFQIDYGKLKGLTKVNSHGDYNNLQILVDEQQNIQAVIDFSSAARVPAVWEIMRSYTLSAVECACGDQINLDELKSYVDAYLTAWDLTLFDVTHMAEFYYFDLLRSAYGFQAKDETTAEFALWRTNMCAYLSKHCEEIGNDLKKHYEGRLPPV